MTTPHGPNEAYFAHVDAVLDLAATLGLHLGLLPTWGDKWNQKWGVGAEVFTPENARTYGRFLGERYRGKPIIWIVGGDRPIESETHRLIVRAMAEGLREGDGGEHLITMHTWGPHKHVRVCTRRAVAGLPHLPERPRPQLGQLAFHRRRLCALPLLDPAWTLSRVTRTWQMGS